MSTARRHEGHTLAELLVAMALMAVVLVIASFVEFNLLRTIRKETDRLPPMDTILAVRQIGRDVRRSTDALASSSLPSVPGARLLLLSRSPVGKDTFTLYRLEDGVLLRSQFLEDGTVLSEDRVLARNIVDCRLTPDGTGRGISVNLAQARGGVSKSFFAMRVHPGVLPPPGGIGGGGEER